MPGHESQFRAKCWFVASITFQAVALFFHFGCGHLNTPSYRDEVGDYVPQGEYSSPKELYDSDLLIKSSNSLPEQHFILKWPLKEIYINQGFIAKGSRQHSGVDLRGRRGDPIYSAHPGTVIYAGSRFRGYGRMVIVEYNEHWATLYAHLNKINVKTGAKVKAGQKIGSMGRSGRASGVHLHFELMHNKIPVDPIPFLARAKTVRTQ
jgi:murein DD-endopeptidase MepM/ murein hydrolase activator NlpD